MLTSGPWYMLLLLPLASSSTSFGSWLLCHLLWEALCLTLQPLVFWTSALSKVGYAGSLVMYFHPVLAPLGWCHSGRRDLDPKTTAQAQGRRATAGVRGLAASTPHVWPRPDQGLLGPQQARGREAAPEGDRHPEPRPWALPFCSLGCPPWPPPHPQVFGQRLSNDLLRGE